MLRGMITEDRSAMLQTIMPFNAVPVVPLSLQLISSPSLAKEQEFWSAFC